MLPLKNVVGLDIRDEKVQDSRAIEGLEMDSRLPEVPSEATRERLNELLVRTRLNPARLRI